MSKVQANIVKLASKGIATPTNSYDEIVHSRRADDLFFKSSLFETINLIQENELLEKVDINSRFSLANLFHWLGKKKTISNEIAVNIFKQLLPIYTDETHSDHENLKELVQLFSPTNEEDSFSITVFPFLRQHLNVYDLVEIIRGLDNFFNHVILKHFDDKSGYSIILLNSFIEKFKESFDNEVKSKSEMSFLGGDGDSIKLSTTEVYRAFLNSIEPIFFTDVKLPTHLVNHINLRFMVETNISHVGELIESTFDRLMNVKSIKNKLDDYKKLLESGNEDEIEDETIKFKQFLTSIIDRLELDIHIRQYNANHRISDKKNLSNLINEQLTIYKKEPHFTIYSLNKLFEFKPNVLFKNLELVFFIKEISETTYLLVEDPINTPNEEMRFFIDRVLKNIITLENFGDLLRIFRNAINTTERNQLLHSMLQDSIMNNRHASALMSFFNAARIEHSFGNKISMLNIEEIANRLGSSYSITRRFKISKFLEDCLAEGKIKGQPIDLLQSAGYFSLIVHKLINQKELEYAFDQYLVMPNFFKDYTDARPRAEYIKKLVLEIEQYIQEVIKKNFQDLFDESDDNKEMHEITRFADTKIVTLLCKELDSRRKDNTVKNVKREEMLEFIDNFAADSRGQYEAERETHNINIADLYMSIQNYSMRVSVVLGDIRQKYNSNVEEIRTLENYIDIERIPIILGGVAVAHSEGTLDFEKIGLFNILDDIKKDPTKYSKLIMDSIDGKFGNIEVKDEMGKTRKIDHQQFNGSNDIIRSFPEEKLCNVFTNVIFIDLLSEVSDALVSSRNMAKNSMELKTALDDIFSRSADLLDFAEREYNKIMGISEDD